MIYIVCLSGPERTRAQAEVALEDAGIPHLPSDHYATMNWASKLPALASGNEPEEPHGFITVAAEDINRPVERVAEAGWVLRVHYHMPPEPAPDPMDALLARLAALEAKVN